MISRYVCLFLATVLLTSTVDHSVAQWRAEDQQQAVSAQWKAKDAADRPLIDLLGELQDKNPGYNTLSEDDLHTLKSDIDKAISSVSKFSSRFPKAQGEVDNYTDSLVVFEKFAEALDGSPVAAKNYRDAFSAYAKSDRDLNWRLETLR